MSTKSKFWKKRRRDLTELIMNSDGSDLKDIESFIKRKKDAVSKPNENGIYPIHAACGHRSARELIDLIMANGGDINVLDANQKTILHHAAKAKNGGLFHTLMVDDRVSIVDKLDKDRNSVVHMLCIHFSDTLFSTTLDSSLKSGADLNGQNSHGDTPLHLACRKDHHRIVSMLLDKGAEVNITNENGETPLHDAAKSGGEYADTIIQLLIKHNADKTIEGVNGTPVQVVKNKNDNVKELLMPPQKVKPKKDKSSDKIVTSTQTLSERRKAIPFLWEIDFKEIDFKEKLGAGTFATVYRAHWRGVEVAVKKLKKQSVTDVEFEDFLNEVTIMTKLRHQNVLLILGACLEPPNLCYIVEYIAKGNLHDVLIREKEMPFTKRLKLGIEISRGLLYLHRHEPPVLHRDLKSYNILVDDYYHCKLSDFGISREYVGGEGKGKAPTAIGALNWLAPELLEGDPFTEKCDIYSFGMVLYELVTGRIPYEDLDSLSVIRAIDTNTQPGLPAGIDPMYRQVVAQCLHKQPRQRPPMEIIYKRLRDIDLKNTRKISGPIVT